MNIRREVGQEFLKEVGDEWLTSVLIGQKK